MVISHRRIRAAATGLLVCVLALTVGCGDSGNRGAFIGIDPGLEIPALVRLIPERVVVSNGETVIVTMTIEDADDLATISTRVTFDDGVLSFVPPVVEGAFMGGDGATTVFLAAASPAGGEITLGLSRPAPAPGRSGSGVLARFEFEAIGVGPAALAFAAPSLQAPGGRSLSGQFTAIPLRVEP